MVGDENSGKLVGVQGALDVGLLSAVEVAVFVEAQVRLRSDPTAGQQNLSYFMGGHPNDLC